MKTKKERKSLSKETMKVKLKFKRENLESVDMRGVNLQLVDKFEF